MIDNMNILKLEEILKKYNQPKFRLKQIQKAVFQDGVSAFSEISSLPKIFRENLGGELKILSLETDRVLEAKNGQSIKASLKTQDNKIIETVLISPKPGAWSVCISSQVGCPMNCRFCATGKMGFVRNLTVEEITDQILFWRQYLRKSQIQNLKSQINPKLKIKNSKIKNYDVSNIVYMGMGEPFLNWENVRDSLKDLINPELFGFGSRSISVSTSGIPEGIEKLAQDFPQVNLAISLHFADDNKRSEFMPVNKKFNLDELRNSLRNYFQKTNRKVFIEYILLDGINDSREDADKLVRYLKSIGKPHLLHVNLINYNISYVIPSAVEESNLRKLDPSATSTADFAQDDILFKPSSKTKTQNFKNYLLENHINATIRKSLGEEIQGACGQLSGNIKGSST